MDIIYDAMFDSEAVEAKALNDRYEQLGMEHWLLLANLGTFGAILLSSIGLYLYYYCISPCKGLKCARKTKKKLGASLFWGFILRMIIEGYMIAFICCLLNARKLDF